MRRGDASPSRQYQDAKRARALDALTAVGHAGLVVQRAAAAICLCLLSGCHGGANRATAEGARASASASSAATVDPSKEVGSAQALAPRALAVVPATSATAGDPAVDFDDLFEYGSADPAMPSGGAVDPRVLAGKVAYEPYANGRFAFSLDVPRAFRAMPEPMNGDGLQWRLGRDAAMTASGMYADPEIPLMCARSKNVTAHTQTKRGCWSTGKRGGFIFWQRERLDRQVVYFLEFQYKEGLKDQMAPIVEHVNASWTL